MHFESVATVLGVMAQAIMGAVPFADVRVISATGWANVLEVLPDLTRYPVAILMAGGSQYADGGATRKVEFAIVLGDEFRKTAADAVLGEQLQDVVANALLGETCAELPEFGGAQVELDAVIPVDLDGGHRWWQLSGQIYQVAY